MENGWQLEELCTHILRAAMTVHEEGCGSFAFDHSVIFSLGKL
jgi:hypothetical protein